MRDKKVFVVAYLLVSVALAATAPATCPNDFSAPSPQLILMHYNTIIIKNLQDNCYVKMIEIAYSKNNVTRTVLYTQPMVKEVKEVVVTVPAKPPYTLSILYADLANNTGTLTWKIGALPLTVHTLVRMVKQGTSAVVQILGPPEKPLFPRIYADPETQSAILTMMSIIAFTIGLIKYFLYPRAARS